MTVLFMVESVDSQYRRCHVHEKQTMQFSTTNFENVNSTGTVGLISYHSMFHGKALTPQCIWIQDLYGMREYQ